MLKLNKFNGVKVLLVVICLSFIGCDDSTNYIESITDDSSFDISSDSSKRAIIVYFGGNGRVRPDSNFWPCNIDPTSSNYVELFEKATGAYIEKTATDGKVIRIPKYDGKHDAWCKDNYVVYYLGFSRRYLGKLGYKDDHAYKARNYWVNSKHEKGVRILMAYSHGVAGAQNFSSYEAWNRTINNSEPTFLPNDNNDLLILSDVVYGGLAWLEASNIKTELGFHTRFYDTSRLKYSVWEKSQVYNFYQKRAVLRGYAKKSRENVVKFKEKTFNNQQTKRLNVTARNGTDSWSFSNNAHTTVKIIVEFYMKACLRKYPNDPINLRNCITRITQNGEGVYNYINGNVQMTDIEQFSANEEEVETVGSGQSCEEGYSSCESGLECRGTHYPICTTGEYLSSCIDNDHCNDGLHCADNQCYFSGVLNSPCDTPGYVGLDPNKPPSDNDIDECTGIFESLESRYTYSDLSCQPNDNTNDSLHTYVCKKTPMSKPIRYYSNAYNKNNINYHRFSHSCDQDKDSSGDCSIYGEEFIESIQ